MRVRWDKSVWMKILLVAGEEGAVLALEELLPPVPVPVVSAQTLHVPGAELTELAGEDGVGSGRSSGSVGKRRKRRKRRGRRRRNVGLDSRRLLEVTELLLNICWLQIRQRL